MVMQTTITLPHVHACLQLDPTSPGKCWCVWVFFVFFSQAIIMYDDLTVHPMERPLGPPKEVLGSKYPLNYPPILLLPPIVAKKPLRPT